MMSLHLQSWISSHALYYCANFMRLGLVTFNEVSYNCIRRIQDIIEY